MNRLTWERCVVWANTGDNSLIVMGIVLMPLFVVVGIGWIGSAT
jgi:hypothetical protein